jgi:hypothetical protein
MGKLENKRRYNDNHRDEVNEANRIWRAEHPDRTRATWLKYKASHGEQIKAHQAKYRKANKERLAIERRDIRYNLKPGQYDAMLVAQLYCCAACDRPFGQDKPYVDHDHACCPGVKSCGQCIRGLIHHKCNVILGYVNDQSALLRKIAEYIKCPS